MRNITLDLPAKTGSKVLTVSQPGEPFMPLPDQLSCFIGPDTLARGVLYQVGDTPPSTRNVMPPSVLYLMLALSQLVSLKATQFEIETSTIMTDQKCLKSIDKVLRVTKVVTFLSCPIFLIATMRRLNSRSTPLLACIYGILSLDCLRMSYNCYARNYCAIGLRSIGSDGNVLKIGSTMLDR